MKSCSVDTSTARGVLTSISYNLAEQPPHRLPRSTAKKAASVAVVLRLDPRLVKSSVPAPHYPPPPNDTGDPRKARSDFLAPLPSHPLPLEKTWDELDGVFEGSEVLNQLPAHALQILFLKRVWRPSDPWSGHVAFPGGRIDPGEEPYTAAVRETWEETGLWIGPSSSPGQALCLGRLPDRPARPSPMLIHSYIFFAPPEIAHTKIELQASEMASYRWIPLDYFGDITSPSPAHLPHSPPLHPSVLHRQPNLLVPPPSAPFRHSEAHNPLTVALPDSALPGRGIPTPSWPSESPTRPFVTLSAAFKWKSLAPVKSLLSWLGMDHVFMPSYLLPNTVDGDADRHFQLWGLSLTILDNLMALTPAKTRVNWPPLQTRSWWVNTLLLFPYLRWIRQTPEAPPPPPASLFEYFVGIGWAALGLRFLVWLWVKSRTS